MLCFYFKQTVVGIPGLRQASSMLVEWNVPQGCGTFYSTNHYGHRVLNSNRRCYKLLLIKWMDVQPWQTLINGLAGRTRGRPRRAAHMTVSTSVALGVGQQGGYGQTGQRGGLTSPRGGGYEKSATKGV